MADPNADRTKMAANVLQGIVSLMASADWSLQKTLQEFRKLKKEQLVDSLERQLGLDKKFVEDMLQNVIRADNLFLAVDQMGKALRDVSAKSTQYLTVLKNHAGQFQQASSSAQQMAKYLK